MSTAPPVTLRRMRWWDVESLLPLEAELFGGLAWSAETFWSELAAPGRWYVVAVDDTTEGLPLAYAGLAASGPEADVQTIAVSSSAQGRGIGATLLRAMVEEASARGATSLLLEVRADNGPAIALYVRQGFERIAVRRGYYQPGNIDAHIMRLRPVRKVSE